MSSTPRLLTIRQSMDDKQVLLDVAGAVNSRTVPPLRDALTVAREYAVTRRIVLDIRLVDRLESEGLSALSAVGQELVAYGRPLFILLTPGSQPERVLRLSDLTNLSLVTDIEATEIFRLPPE